MNWLEADIGKYEKQFIIAQIWLLWLSNILLNLIILVNFLIALISQMYENVMATQEYQSLRSKAKFNMEYYQFVSTFTYLKEFQILVQSHIQDKDYNIPEDTNLGIVNNIKRNLTNQLTEFKFVQDKRFADLKKEIAEMIKRSQLSLNSEMNSKIESEMKVIKSFMNEIKKNTIKK